MIRFWICPKKRKIRFFGFGNLDLDFPKKTQPQ